MFYFCENLLKKTFPVKKLFFIFLVFLSQLSFSQNESQTKSKTLPIIHSIDGKKIENNHNLDLANLEQQEIYLMAKNSEIVSNRTRTVPFSKLQNAVHLCNNGNFEEFESSNGQTYLKNYSYDIDSPYNPIQCKPLNVIASQHIPLYNPSATTLMATTVPSNFIDPYIGNISAFDQYALKINYKDSYTSGAVVQTKRFKTNNEDTFKFNFKTVLQSIDGYEHDNEQPFFKARIMRNGAIVSEFCLIGDPTNCIFTESDNLELGSIVLYTKNWQSGILDISSIPNNEEFIVEFIASRCGLGGHFGYSYIDDLCLLHSDENLQGSIELNPLYEICPTLPISVCGNFTVPNSGGISASVNSITLNVRNSSNSIIYTSNSPVLLDTVNNTFCFEITAANLPNITNADYNVEAIITYDVLNTECTGTSFSSASDNDANPGSDISFLNCTPACDYNLETATLNQCDNNSDGKEFFDLTEAEAIIINNQTGLTFNYFSSLNDATNNTNPIQTITNYESYTSTIYVRVTKDVNCYKIIAIQLVVKNPSATISGILNICSGTTTLTASNGLSFLWSTGETTKSIDVTNVGTYSVTITDSFGCISTADVTILPNQVAVLPTLEIVQPSCFSAFGSITVTSIASQFSFDGGITWGTSNQINNLNAGTYNVRIRTINGCESYDSNVIIRAFQSASPYINTINPQFCGDFGSITVTTTASEYSFDNGTTWTTNNTLDNLPIGIYYIRIRDIDGCISSPRVANIYGVFLNSPTVSTIDPYCSNLGSITITTPAEEYSFDGGTTWQTSNTLNNLNTGSYVVQIKNDLGCTSPNTYVYLNNFENTYPNYSIDPAGCNHYATLTITTAADAYSFDNGATWSTSNIVTNLNGGTQVPIKIRKGTNCYSLTANVYITSYFLLLPIVTNYSTLVCDDLNNNNETVNLSSFNSEFINNPNTHNFSYYLSLQGAENQTISELISNYNSYNLNELNKTIYVRVTDSNGCASIALLELELIKSPVITMNDSYILCENSTVTINAENGFDSYLWSTGETTESIVVDQAGNYTLTVTEDHGALTCSSTKALEVVLSNPATITSFNTEDWTVENNIISVNVTGLGNYEYSLDGIVYQDSNTFYDLETGEFTIYVRDKNECGEVSGEIYLLMYPKFFTPNGDGYNDFWQIKFSDNEPNMIVSIFDRQGKFIKQFGSSSQGWDGNYLGKQLPSTDYWFVVTRENGKEFKGHFTLKR